MASSSNSQVKSSYDIFLSFRGTDTRTKFTDHLYEALKREGFHTFRDENEIEKGESIKSELQKAIWSSRMSIVVLSKNYAKSTACLFEIHTIIKHRKTKSDHHVLPVFYEVDPQEIKEQAKKLDFGGEKVTVERVKGWRAAVKKFILPVFHNMDPSEINEQVEYFDFGGKKVKVEEVEGWSAALKEVASMNGMVFRSQSNGYEAKFIKDIIGVLKSKKAGDDPDLDEKMGNLKRKVEHLSNQEKDINSEISNAEHRPWKRPKKEVEAWLTDVQRFKDDVQRFEQEVVGEMDFFSRMQLGKDIVKKIEKVSELQERRRGFEDLSIDELSIGRLPVPLPKDFVKSTKANTENIWKCLMSDDVRQIGVHGMGGVGKTTIMKHIHNQLLEEKSKFGSVYWVTVSKEFSIPKLQNGIAKALKLNLWDDEDLIGRASQLYATLNQRKRYVLILDDVWEPFALEEVGVPEPTRSNGCKLVLTTRSLEVCRYMKCTPVKVDLLTEEEALTLFLTKAIGCESRDIVLVPQVKEIATKIAKECARLPLAIVTVATSLRGSEGMFDWRNTLNELISSTKDATNVETKVIECLKLSYRCLGNEVLKDCFLYCSLYPEDHKIPAKELIKYWIAEGLIADLDSVQAKFDKGYAVLKKLESASLLEISYDTKLQMTHVGIHDLIRDMALNITASSPRFLVKSRRECLSYEDWSEDLKRISLIDSYGEELPMRPPVCPWLTTLLLRGNNFVVIPDSFFTYMRRLEVLALSDNEELKSLPESICDLENLHALMLRHCEDLEYVPSLEKLKALKVFTLTHSLLKEVPKGIEELVNLRELKLSCNGDLKTFPSHRLRRLSKLQCLELDWTEVEVSAEDLMCLPQLKVVKVRLHNVSDITRYLKSLQFQALEMYALAVGKYNLMDDYFWEDFCIAIASDPFGPGLDQLELPPSINYLSLCGFENVISLSTIPCLKDAGNLRNFYVYYFGRLESIFSSSSFLADGQIPLSTIETLWLTDLPKYRLLFDGIVPPLNISFNLKRLSFIRCGSVKSIFPAHVLQNFPNLEELTVYKCENVEDIIVGEEEMSDRRHTIVLPRLRFLQLQWLPRLKSIYTGIMVCRCLEHIEVLECDGLRRLPLSLHMDGEQATAPPSLREIRGGKEWWESLEWDDPRTKTILAGRLTVHSSESYFSL